MLATMFIMRGWQASTTRAPAAWNALAMYQAKLSLSPTPVTSATLPVISMGIMFFASRAPSGACYDAGCTCRAGLANPEEAGKGEAPATRLAASLRYPPTGRYHDLVAGPSFTACAGPAREDARGDPLPLRMWPRGSG